MEYALLLCGAFLAGLIDAVVGGGGLVQLPLLLAVFPGISIPVLFGTNKLSSIAGTASAVWQYSRKISIPWKLAFPASAAALIGAASGAATVSFLPPAALRPMVLILLIVVGAYTWFKPDFGKNRVEHERRHPRVLASLLGAGIGFYDGFFGPGTGSFLIFGFVRLFGMDMLHASASAKLVNFATNLAALSFFLLHEGVMWKLGLAMACANVLGAQIGTRLAVRHGNRFIRWLLLAVVSVLIMKLAWDLFK
ncbi:sulfite exporter TauE/SafE family protein [Uliginosibacterium aquaticum]|uniref:Probable membrane transporter protein n=1 Tax=Uliginosibacterium aquaticum TaxID=2731212 RepID=A0ABX2IFX6_9RHOO|nr:TSUP family transporter [Uliginosibacterium aquaticum]NSL55669.1 TSUP family transporter [Uliginosibacterium aquaticum]